MNPGLTDGSLMMMVVMVMVVITMWDPSHGSMSREEEKMEKEKEMMGTKHNMVQNEYSYFLIAKKKISSLTLNITLQCNYTICYYWQGTKTNLKCLEISWMKLQHV